MFSASGLQYSQPRLVLFTGQTSSGCGFAQSAMGPFYCPNDQTVYLDVDFFRVMQQQLGSRGEFARAYVIAHEIGHHVQDELGLLAQTTRQRASASERDANAISVRVELQADCYAGIWANAAQQRLQLTDEDIRSALDTAARIGDDALQQASQGRVVPDSFTHGTSEQRQTWFYNGFRSGDPAQCDTGL
jgi:predicted metalloprotease